MITDGTVSLSKESSDSVSSVPPAAHYNDNHSDMPGGNAVSCGKTPLRPDVAAAVPLAVPGRFGRGFFGRTPHVTPTAGGVHHDCRTFGCFRQAAGPGSATAARHPASEFHCCGMCIGTDGRQRNRDCDGGVATESLQRPRPWAPGAPRDHAGRRADVPRHMDEPDDPTASSKSISESRSTHRPNRPEGFF